jgi:RNA polymerase sigma factor (TIGR02999 family)
MSAVLPHPDSFTRPAAAPVADPEPADAHVDALFARLYADLCRLARREVHRHGGADMGPGTLVHEVWLDVRRSTSLAFVHPGQFLAYASRVMRGLVIDRVRKRQTLKRGGDFVLTTLDTQAAERLPAAESLEDIQLALDELAAVEPDLAQVVDLKFFCGFTTEEVATMQGVSERTVQRQWEKARTLLYRALRDA